MPATSANPVTTSTLRFRLRSWVLVVVKITDFLHSQGVTAPFPPGKFCICHAAARSEAAATVLLVSAAIVASVWLPILAASRPTSQSI